MTESNRCFEVGFTLTDMTPEEAQAIFDVAADAVYERTQNAFGHFIEIEQDEKETP